VQELEQFVQEG